jgi:serine palmitoyltransferase
VDIQESDGHKSIVNGASHNYTAFYEASVQSEELQRLCLDKLPAANASAVPLLASAMHSAIAKFFWADFCCTTSTGYGSNYIALAALLNKSTLILLDDCNHNSMFTGAFLGQPGGLRKFTHNNMAKLESILKEHARSFDNVIVAVEGFYR